MEKKLLAINYFKLLLNSLGFLSLLILFLNIIYTPLISDDYNFIHLLDGNDSLISKIYIRIEQLYLGWSGRILTHLCYAITLSLNSQIAEALIRVSIFILITYFSTQLIFAKDSRPHKLPSFFYLLTFIFLFCLSSERFQTIYWHIGSYNYLCMFLFLIYFLYLTKKWLLEGQTQKFTWFSYPLAFLVGCSYENVAISLLGLASYQFLLRLKYKQSFINLSELNILLCLGLGAVSILAAPGIKIRQNTAFPLGLPDSATKLENWTISLSNLLLQTNIVVFALLSLFAILFFKFIARQKIKYTKTTMSLFVLFFLLLLSFIAVDGSFYGRKSFNASLIFALFLLSLLENQGIAKLFINASIKKRNLIHLFCISILLLLLLKDLFNILNYRSLFLSRENEILRKKVEGNLNPVVKKYLDPFKLGDLSEDPNSSSNRNYAKHLGITSIRAKKN